MAQGPLSDWDREQLKKYLHEDKDHTRGRCGSSFSELLKRRRPPKAPRL